MQIYLNWENLNSASVKLEIFRGDTPLDRANLTGPIATLTAGETSYIDTQNVLLGKTYYYVFVTSNAGDRTVSQNYQVTAVSRRGAGPQVLLQGDNTLGYFGTINPGEFLYTSALMAAVGMNTTSMPAVVTGRPAPLWYKYVRNNKILIIPEGPIATGVSWTGLYNLGLVFGQDGTGADSTPWLPAVPVNQSAKVKIGPDWYRVRLMRNWFDAPSTTPPTTGVRVPFPEYDDLTAPIYHQVMPNQRLENIYQNGRYYWTDLTIGTSMNVLKLTQEPVSATAVTGRGPTGLSASSNETTAKLTSQLTLSYVGNATIASAYDWWPVLELIEV